MENVIFERIRRENESQDIVLYMKGTAAFPQCSFSAAAVQILSRLGVPFKEVNVLEDGELRKGLKDYAQWPTLPQLYIKGEFMGGATIIREMYETGELQDLLKERDIKIIQAA
jgi:monothiol glutaredoxin